MTDPDGTELRTLLLQGVPWEHVTKVDEAIAAVGSSWDYIARKAVWTADKANRIAGEPLDEEQRNTFILGFVEGYLYAVVAPVPHDDGT